MTIPLGGVHVDVSVDVSEVGPRLRKALNIAGEGAARDLERRLALAGKRGGKGFASEFNQQAQKDLDGSQYGRTFATQFSQSARTNIAQVGVIDRRVVAVMNRTAATAGNDAGRSFGESFQRGLRGSQDRDLGLFLGKSLRGGTSAVVKFAAVTSVATVAVSALVGAAAPLVNIAAGLGAGAIQASGALALIPAAGAAATASIVTLTVGMQGLGDAFKELAKGEDADPEKLAKAMEALSPAARQVANAYKDLRPELANFRKTVQEELLQGVGDQMERFGTTLLPSLRRGMTDLAGGLNTQFDALFAGLTSKSFLADTDTFFTNATKGSKAAAPGIRSMVDAFSDLTAVGSSFLPGLGKSFSNVADDFASFIDRSRDSGALKDFMADGIDQVKQFGRIARDLGVGLVNTFNIAETAGGGLFDQVERIAGGFRDFTESARGQEQLGTLFESLRRAGDAMAPVFGQLFDTFVQLSPVFADIAEAIGPKLADIIGGIGDALAGVGPEIGTAFAAIGDALAEILPAVVGLAGPFSTLLASALRPMVPVVQALAPVLEFVADALSSVLDVASAVGAGPLLGIAGAFLLLRTRATGLAALIKNVGLAFTGFRVAGVAGQINTASTAMGTAATRASALQRAVGKAGIAGLILGGADALSGGGVQDMFKAAGAGWRGFIADLTGNSEALKNALKDGATALYGDIDGIKSEIAELEGLKIAAPRVFDTDSVNNKLRNLRSIVSETESAIRKAKLGEALDAKLGPGAVSALNKVGITTTAISRAVGRGEVDINKVTTALGVLEDKAAGIDVDPRKLTDATKTLQTQFGESQRFVEQQSLDYIRTLQNLTQAQATTNTTAAVQWQSFLAAAAGGIGGAAMAVTEGVGTISTNLTTGLGLAAEGAGGFWGTVSSKLTEGQGIAQSAVASGFTGIGSTVATGATGAAGRASVFSGLFGAQIRSGMGAGQSAATTGMAGIGSSIAAGAAGAGQRASAMRGPLGSNVTQAANGAQALANAGMGRLGDAIRRGAHNAANQASGLASQLRSNIGTIDLYGVGYNMMSSLGLGIAAGGAAAAGRAQGVAASIRGLFPSSPAKWGPFAGDGHPEILGRNLMNYLASGIGRGERDVALAARRGAMAASGAYATGALGFGRFGGSSSSTTYSKTVNAPINVNAPSADPGAVAAQVANRLDAAAARLP